jgi:hypothetical protein
MDAFGLEDHLPVYRAWKAERTRSASETARPAIGALDKPLP